MTSRRTLGAAAKARIPTHMTNAPAPIVDEQYQRSVARVGQKLGGKWNLERLLGVGGMAAVYQAAHDNGRKVAIKVLHPELAFAAEAQERFIDEAYVANHVAHPGTVPALDDGVAADGSLFLVMDLLDGETLGERWQRAEYVLPVLEVFSLMVPLLDVLRAAHEKCIVHRDVKPDNVFLTVAGEVKLLDFGIAKMPESRRSLKTQVGATMGTPAFMAPEQARGRWEDVDEQSDIWSVGATMFALVCGHTVHEAETNNELLLASMMQPAPPVRTFAPDIPEMAARVIEKALAFKKSRRYSSAEEMLVDVRQVVELLEPARGEQRFSSSPPIAGPPIAGPPIAGPPITSPPFRALPSSLPRHASTIRSIASSKSPSLPTVNSPPGARRSTFLLAGIAVSLSAAVGYLAVAHLLKDETAAMGETQGSPGADLPIAEIPSEKAFAGDQAPAAARKKVETTEAAEAATGTAKTSPRAEPSDQENRSAAGGTTASTAPSPPPVPSGTSPASEATKTPRPPSEPRSEPPAKEVPLREDFDPLERRR